MPPERRIATLVAFAYILEEIATDDAIDLLDLLIRELLVKSQKQGQKERLKSLKDLDKAALQLAQATMILLDEDISDEQVRKEVFGQFDPRKLAEAIATVNQLARGDVDLPEVLLEIQQKTGFASAFTHLSEQNAGVVN
jgi:hypothetical protein